jgi:hypothetical protein
MAKVIGPGATSSSAKKTSCRSEGPGGISSDTSVTMRRGYDSRKTTGLRTEYRESSRAENSKASK